MKASEDRQCIVLCGNPYNPLSATAAQLINDRRELIAIILPNVGGRRFNQGFRHSMSIMLIFAYRMIRIVLRYLGVNKKDKYYTLMEFIKTNPDIPVIYINKNSKNIVNEIVKVLPSKSKDIKCLLISCIFPILLPANIEGIDYAINIHPGLLPSNRGSNPYFWAIAKKMQYTGLTYHLIGDKFDQGPILKTALLQMNPSWSEYRIEQEMCLLLEDSISSVLNFLPVLLKSTSRQKKGVYYKKPSYRLRKKYRIFTKFSLNDVFCKR